MTVQYIPGLQYPSFVKASNYPTSFTIYATFSPTSDGSAAAVLASEEFVKKHGLESKAVEIVGMEMATDFKSTFNDNSAIKVVSDR